MPRRKNNRAKEPKIMGITFPQQRMRRALVALLTSLIVFGLLLARLRPEAVSYAVGDTATKTIRAPYTGTYTDSEEAEKARQLAVASVPDQYSPKAEAQGAAASALADIFSVANEVRTAASGTVEDRIEELEAKLDIPLSRPTLRLLIESPPGSLARAHELASSLLRQLMSQPLRNTTADLTKAHSQAQEEASKLPLTPRYQALVGELVSACLLPNLIYDPEKTKEMRDAAQRAVQAELRPIQRGDVIIYAGETVTQRHIDMFKGLGMIQPTWDYERAGQAAALLGVLLLLTVGLTLYLRTFLPEVYGDDRSYVLLCVTLIVAAALFSTAKGGVRFEVYAISIATAAAIFLSLALKPAVAVGSGLYLGSLAGLTSPGGDAWILLAATICATLASYAVRPRESRSSTVTRAAIVTAITNGLAIVLSSSVFGYQIVIDSAIYSAVGGFLSAVAAAGVVTLIERPLKLTTPLLLLELQNPNEPVLKRLLTEAPGSYQSSIMVANLAEAAAEAVGADPVLTRTACMYHDIGKLKRPYFFIENQFGAENPHSRLSPHLSALVITSHVKDGIELAREIKLPPAVASAIAQHHGTSLVSFMYQRAQAEAEEGEEVRESDFRYPGPKPQTRENAIIMLADTVEAAARAMPDTSPDKVEALVERLVDARIADGQLDESPLTFADITVIKKSFVKTLNGMFHQRMGYPTEGGGRENGPPPATTPAAHDQARVLAGDGG